MSPRPGYLHRGVPHWGLSRRALVAAALPLLLPSGAPAQPAAPGGGTGAPKPPPAGAPQGSAAPARQQGAAPASAAGPEAIADYVEMAGDIRLEPAERAAVVEAERRLAGGGTRPSWGEAASVLARHRGLNAIGRAEIRHAARAALHFAAHEDRTAVDILSRRDPVLVEDAPRKEVVTMADLRAMAATNEFVGRLSGQTPPPMREEPGDREKLRAVYEAQPGMRVATTQAGQRHATVEEVWRRMDERARAEVTAVLRDKVRDSPAVADAARELENIMVAAVQRARNDAALADFRRHMARMGQATVEMARLDALRHNMDEMHRLFR
ncbi:hypothetical protein VQH23_00320 [Pararoseomonas sp. SCSIO 73927]|uniref:hypothetical protein n=1 Tax=Pararoseomonas sp. SCSIO 73927 TaxID=3114537 RepID=UPI0030CEA6C6